MNSKELAIFKSCILEPYKDYHYAGYGITRVDILAAPNIYHEEFKFSRKEYDVLFDFLGDVLIHRGSEYEIKNFGMRRFLGTFFIKVSISFIIKGEDWGVNYG